MNGIIYRLGAAVVIVALSALGAKTSGESSFLITAEVFTLGGGAAIVSSTTYHASVSLGQRSIVGTPASSASYTIESGFQAAFATDDPSLDPYLAWAAEFDWGNMDQNPNADPDDDGFTNWQEYIADTDPTRDNSYFHLVTVEQDGPTATISFHSSSRRVYALWFTTDLTDPGAWVRKQGPQGGIGGADTMTHEQETPEAAGFYRVRVALP